MDAILRIEGIMPFDGDHPLDIGKLSNRDLHTIKKLSGVRANELEEAFEAGDTDLILALAVIALEQNGHRMEKPAVDALWNAPIGKISLAVPDEEEEEIPPASPPPSGSESSFDGGRNETEKSTSSGSSLSNGGDPLPNHPSPTGSPPSDTSARSASVTSPR